MNTVVVAMVHELGPGNVTVTRDDETGGDLHYTCDCTETRHTCPHIAALLLDDYRKMYARQQLDKQSQQQ